MQRTTASEKLRAVGLVLRLGTHFTFNHGKVRGPQRRFAGTARPACGNQRTEGWQVLGDHKQLGERRVGVVAGGAGQYQFGVGGQFDLPRDAAAVGQRDAAHFTVVLAGHQHFQAGGEIAVVAAVAGVVLCEHHFVIGVAAARLRAQGPAGAIEGVPEKDKGAVRVAGAVFLPAGDGDVAPAAVTRAAGGEHHAVPAVTEQVSNRRIAVEVVQSAFVVQRAVGFCGAGADLFGARMGDRDIAWHTLLQQQLAGLDHRLAVEARPHLAVMQGVGNGDDAHALMVGHKVTHDGEGLLIRQAGAGEIQRFIEAITAQGAHLTQAAVVSQGALRVDHGR